MNLSENSQAILLLTAHFSTVSPGEPGPLTPTEYGRFASWLHENGFKPSDLLSGFDEISEHWADPKRKITSERLKYLLDRGMAMAIALEKWNSASIWIMTRADPDYPKRLLRKLGDTAPAVLFGVGDKRLLDAPGLAIVGSRSIDDKDRAYTSRVAHCASRSGLNVVSGGAKGVDETAMLAALEVEGTALGVLACGLLKAALAKQWRPHIKNGQLCLVSSYGPEAGFSPGNAMGRNKYVYALAEYGLIVRTDKGKGGTWSGAKEALKKDLAKVFVRSAPDVEGNVALMDLGARPFVAPQEGPTLSEDWLLQTLRSESKVDDVDSVAEPSAAAIGQEQADNGAPTSELTLYEVFLRRILAQLQRTAHVTLQDLKTQHPDLVPSQLTKWLRRAVEEGKLQRQSRAHRYSIKSEHGTQQIMS